MLSSHEFFDVGPGAGPIETLECRVLTRRPLRVRDSGSNQSVAQVGKEENGCTRCVRFFVFKPQWPKLSVIKMHKEL